MFDIKTKKSTIISLSEVKDILSKLDITNADQIQKRTYDYVIALRMVTSLDGMTADWYNLPEDILKICSIRIVNEVKGVNRVVLDITSKPPGTIEWE